MKIPEQAKRVFKGIIFDVYQWDQALYDGSTATYEAIKRADSVQILATRDNRVLIASEEQPGSGQFLGMLGGRVEEGEDALTAAKRELREESGLESDDWEVLKTYATPGKIEWNVHVFVARNCRVVADQHLDPGERIEVKELSFDEFLKAIRSPDFRGGELLADFSRMDPSELDTLRHTLLGK
jgi:ADP-ribose pyrophosphatase